MSKQETMPELTGSPVSSSGERSGVRRCVRVGHLCLLALSAAFLPAAESLSQGPYDRQVTEHVAMLNDSSSQVRLRAAEALGFLRAYRAEAALVARLKDAAASLPI